MIREDDSIRVINENKDNSNTKKDIDNDAKTNEIKKTIENTSDRVIANSKKEANQIGDSAGNRRFCWGVDK